MSASLEDVRPTWSPPCEQCCVQPGMSYARGDISCRAWAATVVTTSQSATFGFRRKNDV
jgi:hypothetical protein